MCVCVCVWLCLWEGNGKSAVWKNSTLNLCARISLPLRHFSTERNLIMIDNCAQLIPLRFFLTPPPFSFWGKTRVQVHFVTWPTDNRRSALIKSRKNREFLGRGSNFEGRHIYILTHCWSKESENALISQLSLCAFRISHFRMLGCFHLWISMLRVK